MNDIKRIQSITVYTTTQCAFCKVLKQWLDKLGFEYEAIDVEKDPLANTHHFTSFPTTVVDILERTGKKTVEGHEEIIRGFDREKFKKVLDI